MKTQIEPIIDSIEALLSYLKANYPDKMVLDKIDEFERIKLAGKVELAIELITLIER